MTGQEISRLFDTRIDEDYSDYASDIGSKQRLFDDAFIKVIEDRYKGIGSSQKELDEIAHVIVSGRQVPDRGNRFRVLPFPVSAISYNGTIVTFTLDQVHDVIVGQQFTLSGATGIVAANATYAATVVTSTSITAADPGLSGVYAPGSAGLTHDNMVSDYMHMLSIMCRGVDARPGVTVGSITTGATSKLSFNILTDLRDGDRVVLTGVLGVVGLPSSGVYVKRLNRFTYALFSDQDLNTALVTSGTYQGGGVAKRSSYRSGSYYMPDRDISDLSKPNLNVPGVRLSENYMRILPDSVVFDEVKIDYVRVPPVRIDLSNASIRLENYYTERFLGRVIDEAVKSLYEMAREVQQVAVVDASIQRNNP